MEPPDGDPPAAAPIVISGQQLLRQVRDQAMFLVDPQGRIASWNEGVRLILGWDEAEWLGQPVQVAFTADDVRAGVPQTEMRLARANGRADDDRWMQHKSGEQFFALGAMTHIVDEHGASLGFLKVLRDFTAARQARAERERLLASESQARANAENHAAALTAAIDAIGDGVCIGNAQAIQRCNAAALRLFGIAAGGELRLGADELIRRFRLRRERHGALLEVAELPMTRAAQGDATELEMWATRADGQDLWLRCAAAPIRVESWVAGVVAVFSDLSQRLQLHEKGRDLSRVQTLLDERNAELRALTDSVRNYAIYTINPEGRITSWHEGAELMTGHSAEEAIGMPFAQLFTPEDIAAGRPQLEMDVAARSGEYKGDGQRLRKDGSRFEVAVVLSALRGPTGELLGFLKLTQDISQRKHLEREREAMLQEAHQARRQAERANLAKDEFLATISHELRTPLSAILGWAHVLERGVSDAATVEHGLTAISRNARMQVQLIEDLLDMNRIESGKLRLDLQRIELGGVVAAAIDSALPAATAKGIGLHTVFSPHIGAVAGDAARLQQVVANLLNNAIKFTPDGGRVNVALTQAHGQAQITVADTGQGIEADFLARLFERFQQQDTSTTRRHGGLGIGLSIVQHLVQLHGGQVEAQSPGPDMGATFTVTLPLLATGAAAAPAPGEPAPGDGKPPGERPRLDGVTVLLVDDEADVRAVTEQVLHKAGATVVSAASADEALRLLREHRPAVLLSDIGMPDADGYQLIRRVRALSQQHGGDTPAAAFTAYTRPEDRERALASGFQLHLCKPVPPAALVHAVAQLAQATGPPGGAQAPALPPERGGAEAACA